VNTKDIVHAQHFQPSTSTSMLQPLPSSAARQKWDKHLLFELAVTDAELIPVTKCTKSDPPLPPQDAAIQLTNPDFFTGEAHTQFKDSNNQSYAHNITMVDSKTEAMILQHFGSPSLNAYENMMEEAANGKAYFKVVTEKADCKKHSAATRQMQLQQVFPHFHFGAWYDQTMVILVLSAETLQAGNEAGKQPVVDFCGWFKRYTICFIQPIIDNPASGLCHSFCQELTERADIHFPWAKKHVPGLEAFCHPLYSTISPFQGFSSKSHVDNKDADILILVNFGQHTLLELQDYNCQLVLQLLDIVMFLSNTVYHCTLQHGAYIAANKDPAECMAIMCFFHKALMQHREPKKQNIIFLAEQAVEQHRQQKRQHQAELAEDSMDKKSIVGPSVPVSKGMSSAGLNQCTDTVPCSKVEAAVATKQRRSKRGAVTKKK